MRGAVRKMGNSSGVIIPKPLLAEMGVRPGDAVELAVRDGRLVIEALKADPRAGWAEDARRLAEADDHDDHLVWGAFGNDGDTDLVW